MQTGIFNPPLMTGWQLLQLPQLPVLNSVWMEQLYNRSSLSTPPVQPKKKSFNIADILSDDKTESDKDIRKSVVNEMFFLNKQGWAWWGSSNNASMVNEAN